MPENTNIVVKEGTKDIVSSAFFGCSGLTSITIPNSVKSIGSGAFWRCSQLTSITIPESVTSIEQMAFDGCSSLISVTIPESVTSIGICAFFECTNLTSIVIPKSVTGIGYQAFSNCSGLTSITIPESVTSIGSEAFSRCSSLTSVTNLATSPQKIAEDTFYDYDKKVRVLHVLPGCKAAYGVADGWKDFTIVEDATTGIDVVKGTPTISSDKIFSISGQQLNKTKKGVNVINGKKILVK